MSSLLPYLCAWVRWLGAVEQYRTVVSATRNWYTIFTATPQRYLDYKKYANPVSVRKGVDHVTHNIS